jgi:hypothetical protein
LRLIINFIADWEVAKEAIDDPAEASARRERETD